MEVTNMVREANVNDYIEICKISVDDLGYDCEQDLVKHRLENLDSSREIVFVADVDGKAVGYVHAEKYNTLYYKSMVNIQGLAVSKAYRKKGYAKELMTAVENWARKNNIDLIRLNLGTIRTGAHEFYRAIGYDNEKTQIRFMKEL
jgi:GNAT superfamily N-acetyltransferase